MVLPKRKKSRCPRIGSCKVQTTCSSWEFPTLTVVSRVTESLSQDCHHLFAFPFHHIGRQSYRVFKMVLANPTIYMFMLVSSTRGMGWGKGGPEDLTTKNLGVRVSRGPCQQTRRGHYGLRAHNQTPQPKREIDLLWGSYSAPKQLARN